MRVLDFQDGLYRSQPTEKVQSRVVNQPVDDAQLAALKKMQEDALKQTQIAGTERGEGKKIDKDKEEREKGKNKKRDKKAEAEAEAKSRRSPPSDGTHIIDIDA